MPQVLRLLAIVLLLGPVLVSVFIPDAFMWLRANHGFFYLGVFGALMMALAYYMTEGNEDRTALALVLVLTVLLAVAWWLRLSLAITVFVMFGCALSLFLISRRRPAQ